jgi:ribonuclease P protein subunit POP4
MHELIGRRIQIIESSDKRWIGRYARIVDETRNMFTVSCDGTERMLPKKGTILSTKSGNERITIDASNLMFRPEDRIKKARRKKAVI